MSDLAERVLLAAASGANESEDGLAARILDAGLHQLELFGIAKTSVEGIAKRAKVARVTVYRRFAGKEALVEAIILRELRRFQASLVAVTAPFSDPEEQLVEGFAYTMKTVREHALLQRLLESEPDQLLPHLTTQGAPFLTLARDLLATRMATELDDSRDFQEILVAADIVARLVISLAITPAAPVDLDDAEATREFARRHLIRILEG